MIECDFLDFGGGWLGSYRCSKDDYKSLSNATVNMYCKNGTNYKYCPIFKKTPSGGCYLTTVTCEILDLPDNDPYLETMRWYRDNVMLDLLNGEEILKNYNNVGPVIAENLREDKNKFIIAGICRNCYIENSVSFIKAGKKMKEEGNEKEAKTLFYKAMIPYIEMTQGLIEYYHIDPNNIQPKPLEKGIARVRKTEKDNK